jgi:hypothetical protein
VALMKQRLAHVAPYITWFGLFLALAGLLLPLFTAQMNATVPEYVRPALIVIGLVLALAWPLLRPDELLHAMGGRRARFGGNALVLTVSVIGALVVINYLSSLRYAIKDMTSNKQYTISRQTAQILDEIDDKNEKITLTAILSSQDYQTAEELDQLMDRYLARTDDLTYKRIDPQVDNLALLGLAQRLKMTTGIPARAIVAEMGDRNSIVYSGFDEQAVTEALVKVTRTGERKVLFTTGHGEYDPNGSGDRSYSNVKQQLESEGYTVDTVNLATITETLSASQVDVVVIAGPTQPFLAEEADALADYVAAGGSAFVLVDPGVEPNLDPVLAPWALSLQDDIVIQQSIMGPDPNVVVQGQAYQFHSITRDMKSQSVFPGVRSIGVGTPITTALQTTALVTLEEGVYGETDFQALSSGQVSQGEGDIPPPLSLAAAGQSSTTDTETDTSASPTTYGRIVVSGTSALAADAVLQQLPPGLTANFDLFLNVVNWLSLDEDLVSIRATEADDRPMNRPSNPTAMLLFAAVLLPLAVLGLGAYIYWRRH